MHTIFWEQLNKTSMSKAGLFEFLNEKYGLPNDPKKYTAFENGRLTYSRIEDGEGDIPSAAMMQQFNEDKINLWSADFDIYISYAVIRPVSVEEMAEWGAEKYEQGGAVAGSEHLNIAYPADTAGYFKDGGKPLGSDVGHQSQFKQGGVARIPNQEANVYAELKEDFKGNNLEGKTLDNKDYAVLSFGHYPIWYFNSQEQKWYGNKDPYSTSTKRHIAESRPDWNATILSHEEMLKKMQTAQEFDLGGIVVQEMFPHNIDNTGLAKN
jgi:hypothetical protein